MPLWINIHVECPNLDGLVSETTSYRGAEFSSCITLDGLITRPDESYRVSKYDHAEGKGIPLH